MVLGGAKVGPFDTAQQFYGLGVATIPIRYQEKLPTLASWRPYQTQLPTPADLLTWFATPHNVGVVTGWQGLTVIDFDTYALYLRWLWWAAKQGRLTPANRVAKTAYRVSTSRGVHVYLWVTTPERNRKLPGLDIKAHGGYVLGEGSIHPTGAEYKALQPGMIIPTVATLNEVLPASLLLQSDQPQHVSVPSGGAGGLAPLDDPWTVLDQSITITGNLVDRIKARWRVTDFLSDTEQTSGDGRWLRCKCPLHDDADPSFWIDTRDQVCGCFAGCTAKPLDVINLYARLFGLDNRSAIFQLARILP
jgi:hypothetical protein